MDDKKSKESSTTKYDYTENSVLKQIGGSPPELAEFDSYAQDLFKALETQQNDDSLLGANLGALEGGADALPNLLEGDMLTNLASVLGMSKDQLLAQICRNYQVVPVRGGGTSLGNEVLEQYARFNAPIERLGWLPLQGIGPGMVMAHFLPNVPLDGFPDFFVSKVLISAEDYMELYKQFLIYDPVAIRSEFEYKGGIEELSTFNDLANAAFEDIVGGLKSVTNELGHAYELLGALEHLQVDNLEESSLGVLKDQLTPEFNIWIASKQAEEQDQLFAAVGLSATKLSVIDPRDIAYTDNELFPTQIGGQVQKWLEERRIILTYAEGNMLVVASPDFHKGDLCDQVIETLSGFDVSFTLCTEKTVMQLITQRQQENSAQQAIKTVQSVEELREVTGDEDQLDDTLNLEDTENIKHFVNRVIAHAIELKASDIHFDPQGSTFVVRYRLDGHLKRMLKPFRIDTSRLVLNRIKAMSELDLSKSFITQSGRARVIYKNRAIDLRIEILPVQSSASVHSYEKCVMRILDEQGAPARVEDVMWDQGQRNSFGRAIQKPYGCIVVTGPTGSGKSTTLYAAINELNSVDTNILTAEDPVERKISGISQVQASKKLTFQDALRSFLRADPDVILIGEIRDEITAKLVVQASQTGHLVFTTLHTNTALGAIPRLNYLGVRPYEIASSLLMLTGQRLLRKLCMKCRMRASLSPADRARFEDKDVSSFLIQSGHVYSHRGCNMCSHTGYKGRVAIMEMVEMDNEIQEIISKKCAEPELIEMAERRKMKNMYHMGLEASARGFTDVSEVAKLVDNYV
jgi:type II secretory ATPase GspE/PulE/Tfp pilus assembly ATPase PilB-like protein